MPSTNGNNDQLAAVPEDRDLSTQADCANKKPLQPLGSEEDTTPPLAPPRLGGDGGSSFIANAKDMAIRLRQSFIGKRLYTVSFTVYRNFSLVLESDDAYFWSTMVSGASCIPPFVLLLTLATNVSFAMVFTFSGDILYYLSDWKLAATEYFRIITTLFACRCILTSSYELTMDVMAGYPVLMPSLLSRLRSLTAARPRALGSLMMIMHVYFGVCMFVICGLGAKYGPLPDELMYGRYWFVINVVVKLAAWLVLVRPKAGDIGQRDQVHLTRALREMKKRKQVKKLAILYVAASDLLIFLALVLVYALERLILSRTYELEQRVIGYIFLAQVIINATQLGLFSMEAMNQGAQLLERDRWTNTIARSRHISLIMAVFFSSISFILHGMMPSGFTALLLYNSLSTSKYILWGCLEAQRTWYAILDLAKKMPAYVLPALFAYLAATLRSWVDMAFVLAMLWSLVWAFKVRGTLAYFDGWFSWQIGVGLFVALHQLVYLRFSQHIDELFYVTTSDTALNVSTVLGTCSLGLSPVSSPAPTLDVVKPGYPFCNYQLNGFSMLDMASISLLAYLKNGTSHFNNLFTYILDEDWKVAHDSSSSAGFKSSAAFLDVYNEKRNISVISVRGTNPKNLGDIFEDMILYNSAAFWDFGTMFVPVLNMIPEQWASYVVYISYLPLKYKLENRRAGARKFYQDEVEAYAREIMQDREVMLVGHSLGGAIAKIVAARLQIPVFSVSSPGITLSHRIFGASRQDINKVEVTLYLAEDMVPKFDRLSGLKMQMVCPENNPMQCHQLGPTFCELVERCGAQFTMGKAANRVLTCKNV